MNQYLSKFRLYETIKFGIGIMNEYEKLDAKILAIHFYPNKVKYDIEISFTDTEPTRLYNIEEKHLSSIKIEKADRIDS